MVEKTIDELVDESIELLKDGEVVVESDGKIEILDMNKMFKTYLSKCSTCYFRNSCNEAGDDSEENGCVIERKMILTLLAELKREGIEIDERDKLLIYPLVHNFLRMNRLYRLEQSERFLSLLNVQDGQKKVSMHMSMLRQSETMYLKILKELRATRKERIKNDITKKKAVAEMWSKI